MIEYRNIRNNKYVKLLALISLISLFIGTIIYFNLSNNININNLSLKYIIRGNYVYHIFFVLIIFSMTFICLGPFLAIFIYIVEIICFTILILFLFSNFYIKGILLGIVVFIFRSIYYLVIFLMAINGFKILKFYFFKQRKISELFFLYIKNNIILIILAIFFETFNFLIGYKFIIFITNLLGIVV